MEVIKRTGQREPVMFDKITARIRKLCYGLEVEPIFVAQKVVTGVYHGVSTSQLDELAAETAAYMCTQHPDYGSYGDNGVHVTRVAEKLKHKRARL